MRFFNKTIILAILIGVIIFNILNLSFFWMSKMIPDSEIVIKYWIMLAFPIFYIPVASGLIAGLIAGKSEILVSISTIIIGYSPWLLFKIDILRYYGAIIYRSKTSFILEPLLDLIVLAFITGFFAMIIRKSKEKKNINKEKERKRL